MAMNKLSEVEAFRAQVLLEEALRKLNFLTSVSASASAHGDELTQHMGDEISRIIQEQRDLEKRYEELIATRGQLKGLCNKSKFIKIQGEIQVVANGLKESNKTLCRNLKENPNVQGNVLKMQNERVLVQETLEETKSDLIETSFNNLVLKVEAERREQERLSDVKKKARELSHTVSQLEAELQREYADHDKETKLANQEIKELKEELQKNKTISDIEYKFEEKKLRAREQALLRINAQTEKRLVEEFEELSRAKDMEETVHNRAHEFLETKLHSLQNLNQQWKNDLEKDVSDREVELTLLREKRAQGLNELNELEEKKHMEALDHKAKEDEMRNAVLIERQKEAQLLRMADAVLFLQEEGRKYMERLAARKAASKGKNKKKGKKK